jgi:hypothetical protein
VHELEQALEQTERDEDATSSVSYATSDPEKKKGNKH